MAKGQTIGGANGAKRSRMLPPTGEGPIEVTRESVSETPALPVPEQATPAPVATPSLSDLVPAAVGDILTAELPESGEPAEVIVACEKRVYAANALMEVMTKKTLQSYFHYAGPAIRLAWATESWRATKDPSTGKECRSWSAWLRMVGVSRQHAYRMTKEEPIREALKGLDVGKLGPKQIDVLSPVLTSYGAKGVRELWTAGIGWGDTGAASLLKLRQQLGLEPDRQISEGDKEDPAPASDTPVLRFQTKPGVFDESRVREAARAQPEIARLVAKAILAELGEDASQ